jgi:hypothetical protein
VGQLRATSRAQATSTTRFHFRREGHVRAKAN